MGSNYRTLQDQSCKGSFSSSVSSFFVCKILMANPAEEVLEEAVAGADFRETEVSLNENEK